MASNLRKPSRVSAFICLILGLIMLISAFLPIFTIDTGEGDAVTKVAVTPYDAFKALINKSSLLPADIEAKIYEYAGKVVKDTEFVTDGEVHNGIYKKLADTSSVKLFTLLTYIAAVVMLFSSAIMIVFGLLGTLFRFKLFRGVNSTFSFVGLAGGGVALACAIFIGKKFAELQLGSAVAFSYFLIIPIVAAFLAFVCLCAVKGKLKRK